MGKEHWAFDTASALIERFPDKELYTCAAGISPSGVVHFGNFRDVATSLVVCRALKSKGKKARLLFSWDDFDRFRKVPYGIPESFSRYVGAPLAEIPDPTGSDESYALHFEKPFEAALQRLEVEVDYVRQSKEYTSGRYGKQMVHALLQRERIAEILLSFMSDKAKSEKGIDSHKYKENFFPLAVYSEVTGKDSTTVLSFDGISVVRYRCDESGKELETDILTGGRTKLNWKIDWPMRWGEEGVHFEPGGADHASPGGSFDVSSTIAKEIFGIEPPLFVGYDFIGIRGLGSKMSGSKGMVVSPLQLLEIYEPEILLWLYTRRLPNQEFTLAFDSEIFRQYDERDREVERAACAKLPEPAAQALKLASEGVSDLPKGKPIPFRQMVALGQIVQWNEAKLSALLDAMESEYDRLSVKRRFERARKWLEQYNPGEAIELRDSKNEPYIAAMNETSKAHVKQLKEAIAANPEMTIKELEELVYMIPKDPQLSMDENKPRQRAFFEAVYNLLISAPTGPRLPTFLWAVDTNRVLELFEVD
jgi:lysyl-tRNA synthetase class 1